MDIRFAPEAIAQAEAIDDWWRANRPAAQDLFTAEFEAALTSLSLASRIGHAVEHPSVQGLRRILLRATRFHVYYRIRGEILEVVAVWGCVRGRGPDLDGIT